MCRGTGIPTVTWCRILEFALVLRGKEVGFFGVPLLQANIFLLLGQRRRYGDGDADAIRAEDVGLGAGTPWNMESGLGLVGTWFIGGIGHIYTVVSRAG